LNVVDDEKRNTKRLLLLFTMWELLKKIVSMLN
jgi:hypothetical protein